MLSLPKNELRISITSGCNMKCVYCHNEGNNEVNFLDNEQIEMIISSALDFNLKSVRLTGGEPLIHPQIEEICKMLSKKYDLKVGINTNCIEIDKLMNLVNKGYVSQVVAGIDYFDGKISKNSPIGKSSKEILSNILRVREKCDNVSIATVYVGDYNNTRNILKWCIEHKIRLKIIEEINEEKAKTSSQEYILMRNKIIEEFNFITFINKDFNEVNCLLGNFIVLSFFHSHCRIDECEVCKKMHMRISAKGECKQCLHCNKRDIPLFVGNIKDNIEKAIRQDIETYKGNNLNL